MHESKLLAVFNTRLKPGPWKIARRRGLAWMYAIQSMVASAFQTSSLLWSGETGVVPMVPSLLSVQYWRRTSQLPETKLVEYFVFEETIVLHHITYMHQAELIYQRLVLASILVC
jgi:hypothetical protein